MGGDEKGRGSPNKTFHNPSYAYLAMQKMKRWNGWSLNITSCFYFIKKTEIEV